LRVFGLIAKLLTIILLDIIMCYGNDMKAEVSMFYVLPGVPTYLNSFSYMFTFRYFG